MRTKRTPGRIGAAVMLLIVVMTAVGAWADDQRYQVEYEPSTSAPSDPLDGYDPYGRDDSIFEGRRSEVCVGGLPPGSAAFTSWTLRWPGIDRAQTLSCRLVAVPPGRSSRDIPPGDETVYDTWSAHATGRAMDLFVSSVAAGDRLVDYLLAGHGDAVHVVARRLGVLQIIWDGACWEAREAQSRGTIHSMADMRAQYPCAAGASHRDHIHITLSFDGASGTASGYELWGTNAPPLLPDTFFVPGDTHFSRR